MKNKKYLKIMMVTSLLIVATIVVGLLLWNQLPEKIATHFNSQNEANGWSGKGMTVFGLPILMLVIHWVTFLGISADPKRQNIQDFLFKSILWLIPVLNAVMMTAIYSVALGYDFKMDGLIQGFLGLLFIFLGNYLHQVKQNYTVGIKLPWTLNSKENWNRTHRLGAWVFFAGGLAFFANIFLQQTWLLIAIVAVTVLIPTIYSYMLYRKEI